MRLTRTWVSPRGAPHPWFDPIGVFLLLAHCTALRHVADDGAASSETVWTYAELSTLSKRAAATIADALNGSHKGAVVVLPKVPEWWLLNAAAGRCAHVPLLPGTPLLTPWDLAKR